MSSELELSNTYLTPIDQIFDPAFPLGSEYNGTTYVWHQKAEATCFASFVCQELGENPCGEYGLKVSNSTLSIDVCQPLVTHKIIVSSRCSH